MTARIPTLIRSWAAIAFVLCAAGAAQAAALTVSFTQPTFTLARGTSASLQLELHNAGAAPVSVNGLSGTWAADVGGEAFGESALDLLPASVGPGETWIGSIGQLTIAPDAALGHRVYAVQLIGGDYAADTDAIGIAYFAVDVQDPACLASVSQPPSPASVPAGAPATFTVVSSAPGAITYQWRRNGEDLANSAHVSGAQSAQLVIQDAGIPDIATYDVLLATACGAITTVPVALAIDGVTSVPPVTTFSLAFLPPQPNPSAGATLLRWTLPHASHVRMVVHDLAGRAVAVLADGSFGAGAHAVAWDGRETAGGVARPGFYIVRLEADDRSFTRRLLIVR